MCAACWPHLIDFPALVHVVASRLDSERTNKQVALFPALHDIPDFLGNWLSKQPAGDATSEEVPSDQTTSSGTGLMPGMY